MLSSLVASLCFKCECLCLCCSCRGALSTAARRSTLAEQADMLMTAKAVQEYRDKEVRFSDFRYEPSGSPLLEFWQQVRSGKLLLRHLQALVNKAASGGVAVSDSGSSPSARGQDGICVAVEQH